MPKEIYNEGRVVGMSAYEIYLRHQLSEYPEMEPVTEREWLASTIGAGCSMILRIPKDTPAGAFEKQLPDNSTLCAATNITATVFDGQVSLDATQTWATKVISYGPLISNTADSHPTTPGDTVPQGTAWTESQRAHLKEYMKVIDGIVYQPGIWEENSESDKKPYMDLKEPNLNKRGKVRLNISKKLDQDVYVMITGWVHRPIIAGSTKIEEGALNLIHPWNGDFLGAERFPWAVKITFVVPSEVMYVLNDKAYIRQLVTGQPSRSVTAKAIVDFDSVDLQAFYNSGDNTTYTKDVTLSKIPVTVDEVNVTGDGASVLSAYHRCDITSAGLTGANYPPILYGFKTNTKGDQTMVPIDTGAPGTVKIFENKGKAVNYPKVIPNVYSFWHDGDHIYFIDGDDIISLDTHLETKNIGNASSPKYASIVRSGEKQVRAISLQDENSNLLNTEGTGGVLNVFETTTNTSTDPDKFLNWTTLLAALGANKKVDLIGAQLRRFRRNLPHVTSGPGGILHIYGTGTSYIDGELEVNKTLTAHSNAYVKGSAFVDKSAKINRDANHSANMYTDQDQFIFDKPIRTGARYMEFDQGNGSVLRLYISSTAPSTAGVPIGSIGIGW